MRQRATEDSLPVCRLALAKFVVRIDNLRVLRNERLVMLKRPGLKRRIQDTIPNTAECGHVSARTLVFPDVKASLQTTRFFWLF